jgi:peptidoglycan/LPS O-acetylase OafA/YrhL
LADAAAIATAAVIVALPDIGPHRTGPEALLDHAFSPLLAAWICGSTIGSEVGLVGRLLRQPAFAWPGKYAFHAYILWYPLRAFIGMYTFLDLTRPADAVTALLIHWIGSALYAEYVEVQLVRLLRCESCAKPTATVQLSKPQQQPKLGGALVDIQKRDEEIVKLKEQYETLQRRHEMLQQQSEAKGPASEKEEYKGD